jgi:hypothetical protein
MPQQPRPRRRLVVLPAVAALLLAACVPAADAPAAQRGLLGGLLAWLTGADETRAAALEAAATQAETALPEARRRTEAAERAAAPPLR